MESAYYIGVLGGASPKEKFLSTAFEIGKLLAKNNIVVLCGGLDGVMREAARGVKEEGGVCIGILPGNSRKDSNPFLTYSLPTSIGYMRNFLIVRASESVIAIDGSNGTISEESFAISEGRDVIGIGSLELKKTREREGNYYKMSDPKEAVERAILSAKEFRKKIRDSDEYFDS